MTGWLAAFNILNLMDVITTLFAGYYGKNEVNLIMSYCIELHPIVFVVVKLGLGFWVTCMIAKHEIKRDAVLGSFLLGAVVFANLVQLFYLSSI